MLNVVFLNETRIIASDSTGNAYSVSLNKDTDKWEWKLLEHSHPSNISSIIELDGSQYNNRFCLASDDGMVTVHQDFGDDDIELVAAHADNDELVSRIAGYP